MADVIEFRRKEPLSKEYCACGCGKVHRWREMAIAEKRIYWFCAAEPGEEENSHIKKFEDDHPSQNLFKLG